MRARQKRLRRRFIPALPTFAPEALGSPFLFRSAPQFPFDHVLGDAMPRGRLFYLARAGVYHAIQQLTKHGQTVLMPAYHHGVEVEAVRAAGARVVFYRVDEHMTADLDEVAKKQKRHDARLLYLTHFVGFPQPAEDAVTLCRERDLRLFEDCALALGASLDGQPLGTFGDGAVFCLYKSLPVPHGGLLLLPGLDLPPLTEPPLASTLHHFAGLYLAHLELRSPEWGGWIRKVARHTARRTVDVVMNTVKTGTSHLIPKEINLGASRFLRPLIAGLDLAVMAAKRRRNFRRLAERLQDRVALVGNPLSSGACPLFVPVRVGDKEAVLKKLHHRGIEAVNFWNQGDPDCDLAAFPEVARLRREIIELPCHQSLDDEMIEFIAAEATEAIDHA